MKRYFERFCTTDSYDLSGDTGLWPDDFENEALSEVLRALSKEQQELLWLRIVEGQSFKELAAMTGEKTDTVSRRFRRLKRSLAKSLKEQSAR